MSTLAPQPTRLVPLASVARRYRISTRSICNVTRRGAAPWLTHTGPSGKWHRELLVDPDWFYFTEGRPGCQVPKQLIEVLEKCAEPVVPGGLLKSALFGEVSNGS
jgi:hypothetical protein